MKIEFQHRNGLEHYGSVKVPFILEWIAVIRTFAKFPVNMRNFSILSKPPPFTRRNKVKNEFIYNYYCEEYWNL